MAGKQNLDTATAAGLALGLGSMLGAMVLEFNHLNPDLGSEFLQCSAILIIFGGSFGCAMIGASMEDAMKIGVYTRIAFFGEHHDPKHLIDTVVKLAETARKDGILALESKRAQLKDEYPFLAAGLGLVIDGTPPERTKNVLTEEIYAMEQRHAVGVAFFNALGGFAPTMGIIGTVMGLIAALALAGEGGGDSSKVVGAIATAFIATFYGVCAANLVFLPIGSKLQARNAEEVHMKMVQVEAILAIQSGDSPRWIGSFLQVYFQRSKVSTGEEQQ